MPDEFEDVIEEDFLEGICQFPAEVNRKPSRIQIASPFISFGDLIKSLVVDTPDGPKEIPYVPGAQEKVIGFIKDQLTIDFLQSTYGDRGILVASPADPVAPMTVKEWEDQYGTDPIALVLMMRLWWNVSGGVKTTKPAIKGNVTYTKLGRGGVGF